MQANFRSSTLAMPRLVGLALALGLWFGLITPALAQASPFAGWAAIVVAGDWHAHSGGPSEAFDNARHDVGDALLAAGFQRQNLREFSVRPARYHPRPEQSDLETIYDGLSELAAQAKDGCLVYFSSHGAPSGEDVAPGKIEAGCFVIAGDNRSGSSIFLVSRKRILGRICRL